MGSVYRKRRNRGTVLLHQLHVFRPSTDPAQRHCYFSAGVDRLTNATPTDSRVTLDVPVNQISIQPGDVVGVSIIANRGSGIEVDVSVVGVAWYASLFSFPDEVSPMCPYKTALEGNLPLSVVAAPFITVVVHG